MSEEGLEVCEEGLEVSEEGLEVCERMEYRYLVQEEEEEEVQYVRHRRYVGPALVLSRRCSLLLCVGVAALLSLAGYLAYLAQTPRPGHLEVTTDCGRFRGTQKDGAYSFKGIPYAAPPTGQRRWAPPERPACGEGVRDATRVGSMCPQVRPLSSAGTVMGNEDCLFLNVWTPGMAPAMPLPVMVWLHGGFLHMLSGAEEGYAPSEALAAQTGIVYVSFNYRLNALGFLALEVLREGSPTNTSGNYGFMDQIAALQWVQRNIHAFGGDPHKVTILGQSSGGTSVWVLMMSPLAMGLFWAAVDQSGSALLNASLERAERDNLMFLNRTGCSHLACLRQLTTTQILEAISWRQYPSWGADALLDLPTRGEMLGAVAVVDGHLLPAPPLQIWEEGGHFSDVPFLIGTTEQETDFLPPYDNISMWTWGDYDWFVREKLDSFGGNVSEEALALYPSSALCPTPVRCPERAFTTMVSDLRATCPNNHLARSAAAALSSPVHRYLVTHTPSRPVAVQGGPRAPRGGLWSFPGRFSFHGLDTVAFFLGLEGLLGGLSSQDAAFQELIIHSLVHLAREGKMPEGWPEYPEGTAVLSASLKVVSSYSADRCRLWEENGFYSYAWIN
ncbi:para-nitrobenzyl esterase [Osmerus eperlanus]|uniref:para-nitrobenzyl esterase n=1 Tax=Osmerus eperlanus TaxID=29151 RepID=UPI002E0DCF4B